MANEAQLQKLKQGSALWNEWRESMDAIIGIDLTNADLSKTKLSETNLSEVDLSGAKLVEANFSSVYLGGADLGGADLSGAKLVEADLNGSELGKADFSGADLSGANLCGADLSEASFRKAHLRKTILVGAHFSETDFSGADLSGANLCGTDLSEASLRKVILSGANFRRSFLCGADLSGANLSGADFREADLDEADLSGADLSGANLNGANFHGINFSGADLSETDLGEADLSGADLRGVKLNGVDLSFSILYQTKVRKSDLNGADYRIEQLKDLVIEDDEKEPLIVPGQKLFVIIRFKKENPPLLHLIFLGGFIEKYYDTLYVFLFNKYKTVKELQESLGGSLIHRMKDKDDAVKVKRMTTASPPLIVLEGVEAVWILILMFLFFVPKEIKIDLYERLMDVFFKTKKAKKEEELLTTKTMSENINILKNVRELGVSPVDLLPPSEKKEYLAPALRNAESDIGEVINQHKDTISSRIPRSDYFRTILLLRQEGLLTNKLDNVPLANLLELLLEKLNREYKTMYDELGGFDVDIELSEEEDEKLKWNTVVPK